MCIHMSGIKEEWCSLCKLLVEESHPSSEEMLIIKEQIPTERKIDLNKLLEKEYYEKKCSFKGSLDLWTRDEIELVYEEFKNGLDRKIKVKKIYEVAIVLERTKAAVCWMIKHIFSNAEKELHRGKEVIQFRKDIVLIETEIENTIGN